MAIVSVEPKGAEKSEEPYEDKISMKKMTVFFLLLTSYPPWVKLLSVSIIYNFITQTYSLTFFTSFDGYFYSRLSMDLLYLIDIIGCIMYKFFHKRININKNVQPKSTHWIILDIITLFSFDYVFDFGDSRNNPFFVVMSLLLMLRIYRILLYAANQTGSVGRSSLAKLLIMITCASFIVLHIVSCLWVVICGFEYGPWTRGLRNKAVIFTDNRDKYIMTIYFIAVIFTCIGSGDMYPVTTVEYYLSMVVEFAGVIWLSLTIALLLAHYEEKLSLKFEFSHRFKLIKNDLAQSPNIPDHVVQQTLEFYRCLWTYKRGNLESSLFNLLPTNMRVSVFMDQYREALQKSTLLSKLDMPSKRALATTMRSQMHVKGDIILKQGELRTFMMYIIKGHVRVLSPEDNESPVILLSEGSLLCEASLILSTPSPVQVEAGSVCELQILDRVSLFQTATLYQQTSGLVLKIFFDIWEKTISQRIKLIVQEELHKALGIPLSVIKTDDLLLSERELQLPYTWLHEDEMGYLAYRPRESKQTTGIYIKHKKSTQMADEVCAFGRFPFAFRPNTAVLFIWDFIVFVFILVSSFTFPLRAALLLINSFSVRIFLINVIYTLDLVISVMTAIEHEGRFLTSFRDIIWYRLTNNSTLVEVILDALSVVPFTFFYPGQNVAIITVLDLNHLFKTWKILRFFRTLEERFPIQLAVVRITECITCVLIISFWLGCMFYLQACFGGVCRDDSYYSNLVQMDLNAGGTGQRYQHKVSLIMLLGISLISNAGYLDSIPINKVEIILTIALSVLSSFIFGYLVGAYSAALVVGRAPQVAFSELVEITQAFMEKNNVTEIIQYRVLEYLKLQWNYGEGYFILNDRNLYFDTPSNLLYQVLAGARREEILSVPILEATEQSLVYYLANHAEEYVLPPQEVVVYSGTPCSAFYIIKKGFCEKYSGITGKKEFVMGPKDSFCVMEMLFNIPATSEIRTVTHAQLLRVTMQQLENALSHFPITRREIMGVVEQYTDERALSKVIPRKKLKIEEVVTRGKVASWIVFTRSNEDYQKPFDEDWRSFLKYFLMPVTIIPNGKFLKIWEGCRLATVLLSSIFFPPYSYLWLSWKYLRAFRYIFDILTLCDIFVQSHVCFYSSEGVLVTHPKATFFHYLSHNFIVDLLAVIPFDLLSAYVPDDGMEGYYWQNMYAYFAFFPKVVLMYHLLSLKEFKELGQTKNYEIVLADILFVVCTFILMNLSATILVIITSKILFLRDGSAYRIVYDPNTWVYVKPFNQDDILALHILSVYWTICLDFNVTFGDLLPLTPKEMLYNVTTFLVGYGIVTYMMVRSSSTMTGLGIYYTIYKTNLKQLGEFLKNKSVTFTLQNAILSRYSHIWDVTRSLDAQSIFSKFHTALQEDAVAYLYEPTFKECKILKDMDFTFYRAISMLVKEDYYRPGAILFEQNDVITDLFIIHQGEVTLTAAGDTEKIRLGQGGIFGNTADSAGVRLSYAVKSYTATILLKMDNRDFYDLMEEYPHLQALLKGMTADNKIYILGAKIVSDISDHELHRTDPNALGIIKFKTFRYGVVRTLFRKHSAFLMFSFEMFLVLCSAVSFIVITYHAAFQDHTPPVFAVEIATTLVFFAKFVYSIWMPPKLEIKVHTEEDERNLRKRYILKWNGFWLDLFCFIPINLFCFLAPVGTRSEVWSYLNFFNIARIYYMVKFYYLEFLELYVNVMLVDLAKITIVMVYSLHLSSCLVYVVACFKNNCKDDKWAHKFYDDWERSGQYPSSVYLIAFYTAVNIYSSCAIGNFAAESLAEIIVWAALILIGTFHVSILSGQISAVVVNFYFSLSNYNFEVTMLEMFLRSSNTSSLLRKHLHSYAENLWYSQKGLQTPIMLDTLPHYLTCVLKKEIYGQHLSDNPVFIGCHPDLLRQIAKHLQPRKFFPGDVIVRAGTLNGTVYFIDEGDVEVFFESESVNYLQKGDMFGVIQSFYKMTPHSHSFQAVTETLLITLKYNNWSHLLPFFPETYQEIYERIHDLYFFQQRRE